MKNKITATLITALAAWLLTSVLCLPVFAQGTAFTYQGRLNDGGNPAGGIYDLRFTLYDAASVGTQQGGTVDVPDAPVTNGLFTVTLDFGGGVFTGAARWLDIAVRPGASVGTFTNLVPRQKLTPTPYAITAGNLNGALSSASLSGTYANAVTLNNGANSFSGNGANLTALNASQLGSGTVPAAALSNAWRTAGNAGTTPGTHFLGTTDNQPLELRVNNQRGLRLEPTVYADTVNVIGGSARNFVGAGVVGATIGGGGAGDDFGSVSTNRVEANFGTVSGGIQNTIQTSADYATIGGGAQNTIQSNTYFATLGGGYLNTIQPNAYAATLGGGRENTIQPNAYAATIGGGYGNTILTGATCATIPGGLENSAASYAFAAGYRAKANHTGAFVWADSTDADFASTANNQFLIRASGGVGINLNNPQSTLHVNGTARIEGANNWGVSGGEGDFRVGNDSYRFKIGVANAGGGAGDIWMRAHGGIERINVKAPGGTRILSNEAETSGVSLAAGGTAWAVISDRNVKKDFAAVDSVQILEKLAAMPITQWHYKWENSDVTPHIGPMAQDFKAAFYPGTDDKSITTQEADGVALAAIQGLNQKVEADNAELRAENAGLKQRLEKLEQLMNHKLNGGAK